MYAHDFSHIHINDIIHRDYLQRCLHVYGVYIVGWSGLLSKKNLCRVSKQLREMCGVCNYMPCTDMPCILSVCLVSMEMHQSIHIMTDSVNVEEKMSSNCPLSTPRDASTTHILVFPTSATAQVSDTTPL